MSKHLIKHILLITAFIFLRLASYAQEVSVKIGNNNIALNDVFTISVTISNEQIKTISNFPDIPGFQKRGTSSQASTNIINGQVTFTQSLVQNYSPTKEGKYKLGPFSIEVNGKKIQSAGTVITVGAARQQQNDPFGGDPFAEFFGRGPSKEYVDVKEEAFFALSTNKDKVYVGEGFTTTLAFYVAENNKAEMQFYDVGTQMQGILKKLKPSNCWEENYGIEEIQPEQVVIDGKKFSEYKLYRATYYPLNKEPIKFPSFGLKMIKYKVAKSPSFFGQNKQQDFKTFNTRPKTIFVKELPPHPLRDNVSIGQFKLEESISAKKILTGKSFNYNFKIVGEGNIQSIRNPSSKENKIIDIYPPNIYQSISRSGMAVTGSKTFNYFMVPKEPGSYKLSQFIEWIYFNTKTGRYDTLVPKLSLNIAGESTKNAYVNNSDHSGFKELIEGYHNKFINENKTEIIKLTANIILLIIFILTIAVILKK